MHIPQRLLALLATDAQLHGSVNLTLHDFEVWFKDRNLTFFPEYTDHGPEHVDEVIAAAEALIKDESWPLLTPEDAAVLILGILLHDCAMHLSEEGFIDLVSPEGTRSIVEGFGDDAWPEIWTSFLSEASRFDARKLKSLFGDSEPIRRPPLDSRDMSLRDRLLIGEFLRRHHHRLAHEIALWGVPGPSNDRIGLVRVPSGLDNLAGQVARSHGLTLRESIETIPRIHRREYLKVHVPFLMTVTRLADYIQIHNERAPEQILKVRSLKSPFSQGEWRSHSAVEDITCTHDDPEAIVVIAKPEDVKTYLKLSRLLNSLQDELDSSWAVLGEVYGRVQGLKDLGLTIRRVRSNLDDEIGFSRTVSYYPDKILFGADPEILKLLVAPLYGNKAGIGIRELVQNSVDACLELQDYVKSFSPVDRTDIDPNRADVTVHLEHDDKGGWVTVSDQGIGMTPDVIKNYFLKAGASFRRSDAWKSDHETAEGKSRVLRSGRFGIGLLAAFLLGDRLEVKTRHAKVAADAGIQFGCSIDDEEIELQRANIPRVGTEIRIQLSKAVVDVLTRDTPSWIWYYLETPSLERKITAPNLWKKNVETRELKHADFIPASQSVLPRGWHRIHHKDFADIQWRYRKESPGFFCNGIKVVGGQYVQGRPRIRTRLDWPLSLQVPEISVFDPDGKLPLNLERSQLTRELAFEPELLDDVCRDLIAYLLTQGPKVPLASPEASTEYMKIYYPGIEERHTPDSQWFWCTPVGLSLASKWFLHCASPQNLYLIPHVESLEFEIPKEYANVAIFNCSNTMRDYDAWIRFVLTGTGASYLFTNSWLKDIKTSGRRILISTKFSNRIREFKVMPKTLMSGVSEEWSNENWLILGTHGCSKPSVELQHFAKQANPNSLTAIGEWYFESAPAIGSKVESPLERLWSQIIGERVIPFDPDERRRLLIQASGRLNSHIKAHR